MKRFLNFYIWLFLLISLLISIGLFNIRSISIYQSIFISGETLNIPLISILISFFIIYIFFPAKMRFHKIVALILLLQFILLIYIPYIYTLVFVFERIISNSSVRIIVIIFLWFSTIGLILVSRYQNSDIQRMIYMGVLILFTLIIALFISTALIVELRYPMYINDFKNIYGDTCTLEKAWDVAVVYKQSFYFTYGVPEPKPRQVYLIFDGVKYLYVYKEVEVLARTGSCEDFAIAVAKLLEDVLGCETRVIGFVGLDHAFPEVRLNGTWYVFDISFTTPLKPVPADQYFEYLKINHPNLASSLQRFLDRYTGKDVSLEHGFIKSVGVK